MEIYNNLVEAINGLKQQGYGIDYNLEQNCIICSNKIHKLHAEEFKVDKYFRFDGDTNPEEESIIYAISSLNDELKGILINGFGSMSDDMTNEMIEKLKI